MRSLRYFTLILVATLLAAIGISAASSEAAHAAVGVASTPITVGSDPTGIAVAPNGLKAYVANHGNNTVSVISLTNPGATPVTISVGMSPRNIAFTPDGTKAYVTNSSSNSVSVIDVSTNTVSRTITVGAAPAGIAFTPDGTKAYVANFGDGTVSVITVATNTVDSFANYTLPLGATPMGIAISPDGRFAAVTDNATGHNVVFVIYLLGRVVVGQNVGSKPYGVAFTPDSSHALITNFNGNTLSVLDMATTQVTATIAVGSQPTGVAITPNGALAYVTNDSGNTVSIIDLRNGIVTRSVAALGYPTSVAITPDGAQAWIVNRNAGGIGSAFYLDVVDPMVLTFDITAGNAVSLPLHNFIGTVGWGDGSFSSSTSASNYSAPSLTHTYSATNHSAVVTITGTATGFGVTSYWNGYNKLTAVTSWGDLGSSFTSLDFAFFGASNLISVPSNLPASVISLSETFAYTGIFNDPNVASWNVSNVQDMTGLFEGADAFNQNIGGWNVSNVSGFSSMFNDATAFNQDISGWSFTTLHLILMDGMFEGATSFNQNVSLWDVSHVSDFSTMFKNASTFNQNLSSWDVNRAGHMGEMFDGSALSTVNYSNILHGWAATARTYTLNFGASGIQYSSTVAADRAALVSKGWTITDGGQAPVQASPSLSPSSSPSASSSPSTTESESLPHTGRDVSTQITSGVLALMAGLALVALGRSRRRQS